VAQWTNDPRLEMICMDQLIQVEESKKRKQAQGS